MSRPNCTIDPSKLTASDALCEIIAVLKEHFPLETPGRKWVDEDIYRLLIKASAEAGTVEHTCKQMEVGPDANTVFYWLKPLDSQPLRELEGRANEALIARLPPRLDHRPRQAAVDFVLIPYHGEPAREEEEIRRGRARDGTTRFHCYATVYIIYKNKRVTVALTVVRGDDDALTVLSPPAGPFERDRATLFPALPGPQVLLRADHPLPPNAALCLDYARCAPRRANESAPEGEQELPNDVHHAKSGAR
jgi:hypothetical protein